MEKKPSPGPQRIKGEVTSIDPHQCLQEQTLIVSFDVQTHQHTPECTYAHTHIYICIHIHTHLLYLYN